MLSFRRWWERWLLPKPTKIESLILSGVEAALPDELRSIYSRQARGIAGVKRMEDGGKIYFIFDNDFTERFDACSRFAFDAEEVVLARVKVEYYRHVVAAQVWVVNNILFSIEYTGPALPGGPNHVKVIACEVLPDAPAVGD